MMTKHNQRRRWLRWYSSHFWSSRPYPNHKRIAIFREFRSYFQSFPLCGEYFMWHFLYFAQFRWWESTSYKWSYGAPKKNLVRIGLVCGPQKAKNLLSSKALFRVPTTPPQGIRRFSWIRGPPRRVVSLTGGFKSPRPNG